MTAVAEPVVAAPEAAEPTTYTPLSLDTPLGTSYCIEEWRRDEQIRWCLKHVHSRLVPQLEKVSDEPVAIVGFGPSLQDTWEALKDFKVIFTMSGSHKFCYEHGIRPTYHVEVDPRPHKIGLMGTPQPGTIYLPASCVHPDYFRHLLKAQVEMRVWHVFHTSEDALRLLPPGEWSLAGGSGVGVRAMVLARFMGYRNLHMFGYDGCYGKAGSHAGDHPIQKAKSLGKMVYDGVEYITTPAMLAQAKETWQTLDQLADLKVQFYGEGLVQHIHRYYQPKKFMPVRADHQQVLAVAKQPLFTPEHQALQRVMHDEEPLYGTTGIRYLDVVLYILNEVKPISVLDYGCGKGLVGRALNRPIWEYDPGITGKEESPRTADVVICTHVLEHVEPECLDAVLDDLRRCIRSLALVVVSTHEAQKCLPDGRNTHLIVQNAAWWKEKLTAKFQVGDFLVEDGLIKCVIGPQAGMRPGKQGVLGLGPDGSQKEGAVSITPRDAVIKGMKQADLLITPQYRAIQREMFTRYKGYGTSGKRYVAQVRALAKEFRLRSILDYGCGRHTLAKALRIKGVQVRQYDPAVKGYELDPEPADLVVCNDVLEHVEPQCLDAVLKHLVSKVKQVGLVIVATNVAMKQLPDGRNAHLIVRDAEWWRDRMLPFCEVGPLCMGQDQFLAIITPKGQADRAITATTVLRSVPTTPKGELEARLHLPLPTPLPDPLAKCEKGA